MGSPLAQLESLLDDYSNKRDARAHDEIISEIGSDLDPEENINKYFGRIYILNIGGRACDLESRLLKTGLNNYQIMDAKNPRKGFLENLKSILIDAQQNQYEKIVVIRDDVKVHRNIIQEFKMQSHRLGDGRRNPRGQHDHRQCHEHRGAVAGSLPVGGRVARRRDRCRPGAGGR